MRILIACEYSGRVRDAFRSLGHDAISCDIVNTDRDSRYHYKGRVEDLLGQSWDMMIAFPPCTHLSASGARWWPDKVRDGRQGDAIRFVEMLWDAPIPRIAIENPVGCLPKRSKLGKATQLIQPWQHGEPYVKTTCLWLKNLPLLTPSDVVPGRRQEVWRMPPSEDRAKKRSLTYQGIANAMAKQWSAA